MSRISLSSLSRLCRRLGTSIEAGVDVRTVWGGEATRAVGNAANQFNVVKDQVANGHSVADGLRATNGYFPPLMCEMVEAGEFSGRLGEVFHQLADHYDNLVKLRRSFLAGIWWPLFELAASIVIVGVLILVLGVVADIAGGEPIDIFGFGFGTTGNFIVYSLIVIVFLSAVTLPIVGTMRGWFGSTPLRLAHRIPLLGQTIQVLSLSRMAWSLGMAIDAGMDAIKSLRLSMQATQNPLYVEQIPPVCSSISEGNEMHVALAGTGVFPNDFVVTLENGELTGQVTESMNRLSSEYRAKAEHLFRAISILGGVLVMMLVGAVIITMIFVLFTKLYLAPLNEAAGI